ncbi:response regulator transcription factor [Fusobacterium sp. MFO224]|uniref:response regulator transcription factor n=1 Tax=Fusobacterium sp. MFO224 TaxID=3378070 RepID=UPI003851FA63
MNRILIIDDAKEICYAISEYFNLKGWKVEVAYDIEAGLKKLREIKFDVILVDYNLPYINGVVGTRLIRQIDKNVLIMALTILGEEDVAENFFKAGANDFAVKPIKMLDLFCRIKSHLSGPSKENIKKIVEVKNYPKGIDENTYKLIENYLKMTEEYVDVLEIAKEIMVAKKTVNRYLKYMVSENIVNVNLIYGKIGRPKKEYKLIK